MLRSGILERLFGQNFINLNAKYSLCPELLCADAEVDNDEDPGHFT